uniref:Vacuolar basic amino acid transporter 2 n=1 Tax=Talaromyces marneffei PM1 TaxID=1077442 RepID=A0A093VCS1_TALMA
MYYMDLGLSVVLPSVAQSPRQSVGDSASYCKYPSLSVQLVGLSLGGNELPWSNPWIVSSLIGSMILLALFLWTEARTSAAPIIPLRLLQGTVPICIQIANLCVGMGAYAFLFNLPLFFQVVLLDSASTAGARLVIPSLATPVGGLIAGIIMSRWGRLSQIVQMGALLMFIGNLLVALLRFNDANWKYFVYVFPANLGQGMVYPGILFSFLATFDHTDHAVSSSTVYLIRSLGNVWGVAITSAVVQNQLKSGLAKALSGIPDQWKVVDEIRHSVSAIYDLPPDIQMTARSVYYDGLRMSFALSASLCAIAALGALFVGSKGLHRPGDGK